MKYMFHAMIQEPIDEERLTNFWRNLNDEQYFPKLHCTCLDLRGNDPAVIIGNSWNGTLIAMLAQKAQEIVDACEDDRFGPEPINWKEQIRSHIYYIVHLNLKTRPLDPEETVGQIMS